MKTSVIIVKYRSEKYLDNCLESVRNEKPHEIIVVDNDKVNQGYGAGCNIGAQKATGDILLFLNPDTKLLPGSLKEIANYFIENQNVGVIGPKLFTGDLLQTAQLSCCRKSGLVTSLVVYGKIQRWFVNNPWWNNFTYQDSLATNRPFQVDVVSGAALAVRKKVFKRLNGFDPNMFLYFEENDFCVRAGMVGNKVVYLPQAEVIHYGGGSMEGKKSIENIYRKSRQYYFSKHYPAWQSKILNILLR